MLLRYRLQQYAFNVVGFCWSITKLVVGYILLLAFAHVLVPGWLPGLIILLTIGAIAAAASGELDD